MAKVICVLYDDPVGGYPKSYARDDVPKLERYPDGQTLPTPKKIDFTPGQLLGSVSGELGLRKFIEEQGHILVVTSDKDGPDSVLKRELPDADIVISQPFWPAYLTKERIAKAPKLKVIITAGIGSDHTDLQAAMDRGITVAEVTYCNSISVSEHVVMIDPGIGAQLHSFLPVGGEQGLEHRRLRCAILRYGRNGSGNGRRRAHRHRSATPPQALRHETALHRPPPLTGIRRKGARRHLPSERRVHDSRLRRCDY